MDEPFLKELKTEDEVNKLDMSKYRYECYSQARDCYIFVKRKGQ